MYRRFLDGSEANVNAFSHSLSGGWRYIAFASPHIRFAGLGLHVNFASAPSRMCTDIPGGHFYSKVDIMLESTQKATLNKGFDKFSLP